MTPSARPAAVAAAMLLVLPTPTWAGKRKDRNAEPAVDLEQVCPTVPPENYRTWRGDASHPDKGIALKRARADAYRKAQTFGCEGLSPLRCSAVHRNLADWKEGHWDAESGAACAAVSIKRSWLNVFERELEAFDRDLGALASQVAAKSEGTPLQLQAPTWPSGCVAGELGAAVSSSLQNALAKEGGVILAEDGPASEVRLRLTPGAETVVLSANLVPWQSVHATPLPGFSFPADLFNVEADDTGTCRGDAMLGLEDGAREGADGRNAWLVAASTTGRYCEGEQIKSRLMVSTASRVHVYSVAGDGTAYHVWPPPGGSDHVDESVTYPPMDLVSLPDVGDERLVVVASATEQSAGVADGWSGFCRVARPFDSSMYPKGAAVGSLTFTVLPPDHADCGGGEPLGPKVLQSLASAPECK